MIAFSSSMKESTFFFMSVVHPPDLFFMSSTMSLILTRASLPDTGAYRRASPAPIRPPARNATNTPPALQFSFAMTTLLSKYSVHNVRHGGLRTRQHPGHGSENRKDPEIQNPRGRVQRLPQLPHPFRHVLDVRHAPLGVAHNLLQDGIALPDPLRRPFRLPEGIIHAPRHKFT